MQAAPHVSFCSDGLDEVQALFLEAKAAEQEAEAAAAQQLTSEPSSASTTAAGLMPGSSSRSEALRAAVQRTASLSSSAYVWEVGSSCALFPSREDYCEGEGEGGYGLGFRVLAQDKVSGSVLDAGAAVHDGNVAKGH